MGKRGELKIFANRSGEAFAREIIGELNKLNGIKKELDNLTTIDFASGAIRVTIDSTVRGADVYLVQNFFDPTTTRSIHDNLIETLQTVNALKLAGANKVNLVIPHHIYSRQDKSKGREPITARLIADMISISGADNVLVSDLHADQETGFYNPVKTKIDNLMFSSVLIPYLKERFSREELDNMMIMGPDAGGAARAEHYARKLGTQMAHAYKKRSYSKANYVEQLKVLGLFEGKDIFVIDDMIDTGGSMVKLVEELRRKGARKIMLAATHLMLNKDAIPNLSKLGVEILGSGSIPRDVDFWEKNPCFKKISMAPLYARAIHNLNNNYSLMSVYQG